MYAARERRLYAHFDEKWASATNTQRIACETTAPLAERKNALEAIERPGKREIATRQQGTHDHITFRDDGRGIPREKLQHIFDFGFSKSGGDRVKFGTGLATADDTVQKHGGKISVKSKRGEGTLVEIQLPLHQEA